MNHMTVWQQVRQRVLAQCTTVLGWLRQVSGDDAYERYLAHHAQHHAGEPLMNQRAFYLHEQQRKWNGVKRCC